MATRYNVVVSSKNFDFYRNKNKFVAMISDFGKTFNFGEVFDDSCDVGFMIESHRTGQRVAFALEKTHYDRDDDITYWEFKSVTPNHLGYTAVIYND